MKIKFILLCTICFNFIACNNSMHLDKEKVDSIIIQKMEINKIKESMGTREIIDKKTISEIIDQFATFEEYPSKFIPLYLVVFKNKNKSILTLLANGNYFKIIESKEKMRFIYFRLKEDFNIETYFNAI